MSAPDMTREEVVEEIAESEVALADLSAYSRDALRAILHQLRVLREEARRFDLSLDSLVEMLTRVERALNPQSEAQIDFTVGKLRFVTIDQPAERLAMYEAPNEGNRGPCLGRVIPSGDVEWTREALERWVTETFLPMLGEAQIKTEGG